MSDASNTAGPAATAAGLPPLRVARRREVGAKLILELVAGIAVECRVPEPGEIMEAEAAAQSAMATLRDMPDLAERYGFPERLTDEQVNARSRHLIAVEAAVRFWTDWNFGAEAEGEGQPVKRPLIPAEISLLLAEPQMRAAWLIQLDALGPLEFVQGNG